MNITCSQCDANVPEGASACPKCKAGLGTVVFGKKKSLTRSLIGKAVELRTSIPWATASSIEMVDDGTGRRPRRKKGLWLGTALALLVLGGGAAGYFAITRGGPEVELAAVEVKAEPPPAPAEEKPKPAAKVRTVSATAPRPGAKAGTLSVEAIYKGKSVAAKVVVNGEAKGATPVSVPLGAGKYTVKILKTGFISAKLQDVQIDAGRNTALKIDLKK